MALLFLLMGNPGAAVRQLLDEDRDRRVGACVGHMAGHLAHGDRVAGDQSDQAASALAGLRVEGQRVVEVKLQESHQPSAALRLPDQRAELLIGGTRRQLGE